MLRSRSRLWMVLRAGREAQIFRRDQWLDDRHGARKDIVDPLLTGDRRAFSRFAYCVRALSGTPVRPVPRAHGSSPIRRLVCRAALF